MVTIRDQARVTMSGIRDGSTIEEQARLLWESVHRWCRQSKAQRVGAGYRYVGSLQQHVLSLWPEQSTSNAEKLSEFTRPIYAYLRATNNAVCEAPRAHPPIWWISDIWAGAPVPSREPDFQEAEHLRQEAKVTPAEAGEDRSPAPIFLSVGGPMPAPVPAPFLEQVAKRTEEHNLLLELTQEFLTNLPQPVVAAEVAHVFDISSGSARDCLNELVKAGKLFAREETTEERRIRFGGPARAMHAQLYSGVNPVPPRTERIAVDGYLNELIPVPKQDSTADIDDRLYIALRSYIRHGSFTPRELAAKADVAQGTIHSKIKKLSDEGLIVPGGRKKNPRHHVYRVPKEAETKIRERAVRAAARQRSKGNKVNGRVTRVGVQPTVQAAETRPPVPPFVPTSGPAPVHTTSSAPTIMLPEGPDVDVLEEIRRILGPTTPDASLAAENATLLAENADLRNQLRKARAALRALTEEG